MKRAALPKCADCDLNRFKVLKAQDQLPFLASKDYELNDMLACCSGAYSLADAFHVRLARDLIGADVRANELTSGVSPRTAAKIVWSVAMMIKEAGGFENVAGDLWTGQIIERQLATDSAPVDKNTFFCGPPSDLRKVLANTRQCEDGVRKSVVRINIVDAAHTANFVVARADGLCLSLEERAGLDF